MNIDIEHACCFTGHRPERLENITEQEVKKWLRTKIEEAVNDGYTDFISGMQRGVDIWAAEEVLKLREKNANIHLFAASAFKGMQNSWEESWKMRYVKIMNSADGKVYVSDKPGRAAFFKRNEWLVDHSSRVLAVYTGAPGGTKETINYALKNGREVISIKGGHLTQ